MQLKGGSLHKTGDDVGVSDSLEAFTDSIQNNLRITQIPNKVLTTIENLHESLSRSNVENPNTFDYGHMNPIKESSFKVNNDLKRCRRVLKGAGNKYERDREQFLHETTSFGSVPYSDRVEEFYEGNSITFATFESFVNAAFSNTVFEDCSKKSTNTNPFTGNDSGKCIDLSDLDIYQNIRHSSEVGLVNSCFLMRYIEMRKRAYVAFEEAAWIASLCYNTKNTAGTDVICAFNTSDTSNVCEQDKFNKNRKITGCVDTTGMYLLHDELPVKVDHSKTNIEKFPSVCSTASCWKQNDGFCPHVEAFLPDSESGNSSDLLKWKKGDHLSCSWLEVLVSQIGISSPPSVHSSFHARYGIPFDKFPNEGDHETVQIAHSSSRSDDCGRKSLNEQIHINNDEDTALLGEYSREYPFVECRNSENPFTKATIVNTIFQRDQKKSDLSNKTLFGSSKERTASFSPNDDAGMKSTKPLDTQLKWNTGNFDEKYLWLKFTNETLRTKTKSFKDFGFRNKNSLRGLKNNPVFHKSSIFEHQSVKGGRLLNQNDTFYFDKGDITIPQDVQKFSSVRTSNSSKFLNELKDNSENTLESITSTQTKNSLNQAESSTINFDRRDNSEHLDLTGYFPSYNNIGGEDNCVENIRSSFGQFHPENPPSEDIICTQRGFSLYKQWEPCRRRMVSSDDNHDRCEPEKSSASAQDEQAEFTFQGKKSHIADLEIFVNMENDTQPNIAVDLDLGSSSWTNVLASKIQAARPNETLKTNTCTFDLSLGEDLQDLNGSCQNEFINSNKNPEIFQYPRGDSGVTNIGKSAAHGSSHLYEISSPVPSKYIFAGSIRSNDNFKINKKSSLDVSSRLDALNARIERTFFNVDAALSKSKCLIGSQGREGFE